MDTQELRALSHDELKAKEKGLKEELYKLRLKRFSGGNVDKPHLFKAIRKDIARIQTILNDKKEKS